MYGKAVACNEIDAKNLRARRENCKLFFFYHGRPSILISSPLLSVATLFSCIILIVIKFSQLQSQFRKPFRPRISSSCPSLPPRAGDLCLWCFLQIGLGLGMSRGQINMSNTGISLPSKKIMEARLIELNIIGFPVKVIDLCRMVVGASRLLLARFSLQHPLLFEPCRSLSSVSSW